MFCDPMDCTMPGFPVHHHLLELLKLMSVDPWCHPTISSSAIPFSSCLQSFPASGSFPMSQFFPSGGQNIGASASVLPMNIQDWFPLGLTGLISLLSKGLSKIFSNTTIQKHQFFSSQLSSESAQTGFKFLALPHTWVWVNSVSWWWTGRPGVLQFMGSQRVRHDWATELNWTTY